MERKEEAGHARQHGSDQELFGPAIETFAGEQPKEDHSAGEDADKTDQPMNYCINVQYHQGFYGCADNNGQFGGTISRIALGTASYRTLENRTGSPSRLTGIASLVQTSAQGVCQ